MSAPAQEGWERPKPPLEVTPEALTRALSQPLEGRRVLEAEALDGGLANTNLRLRVEGEEAPRVLRLYQRDPSALAREEALASRVAGLVPTPGFVWSDPTGSAGLGPAALLTWARGRRVDLLLASLDPAGAHSLARAMGRARAALDAVSFATAGHLGPSLEVVEPLEPLGEALLTYLEGLLASRAGERVGQQRAARVRALAGEALAALEETGPSARLVHADFKGCNMLAEPDGAGGWRLTALLDWEFAFSGPPLFDLGQALRHEDALPPGFADQLAGAFVEAGGHLGAQWRRQAAALDLLNLLSFLDRPGDHPRMMGDVMTLLNTSLTRFAS